MAVATAIFHRRSIDLFKALVIRFSKKQICTTVGGDADKAIERRSDGLGTDSHVKELDLVLTCLRVDRVAASGFGIGRIKIQNLIAAKELFVNKLNPCKSDLVNMGDEIDLTRYKDNYKVVLSRFKVSIIHKDLTKKAKRRLVGVRYGRIIISREEYDRDYPHQTGHASYVW